MQLTIGAVGHSSKGVQDYIPTPPAAVDALVASRWRPPADVLDPFAGGGAILRRLIEHGWEADRLHAVELRPTEMDGLAALGLGSMLIGDWFELRESMGFACPSCFEGDACDACGWPSTADDQGRWIGWPTSAIVTNVPWFILQRAVLSCLETEGRGRPGYVASLQPVEEQAGVERCTWMRSYPPTGILNLVHRQFPGSRGIAWYIWEHGKPPLAMEWR